MIELASLLLNLVLGSSLVLFYSSAKRKQAAEASSAEIGVRQGELDIHRHSVEFLSKQLSEAYSEIDKMQDIINDNRNHILELMRISKQLEMDLITEEGHRKRLSLQVCTRAECAQREGVVA